MFYHLWTMRKHLAELQQGTTVSIRITEYTIWKINQDDEYNCETSTSTPFHTTTKQTATVYTISVGVSLDELYKTHAGLRKLIQFLTI
jgi:hypothetical protein